MAGGKSRLPLAVRSTLCSAIVTLLLVALVSAAECGDPPGNDPVQIFFTDPRVRNAPADRCDHAICTRLLQLIRGAQTSIDFAVYGTWGQTRLLKALEAARSRGVTVRGVVDRDREGENVFSSTDRWVRRLGNVRDDYEAERILDRQDAPPKYDRKMHNKFFVVDGRWVWTGSANVSDAGTGGHHANVVAVVDSPELAGVYMREFAQMWAGHFHQLKENDGVDRVAIGGTDAEVWFSPQDQTMRRGVLPLITRAQRRIDVAMYYLTSGYAAEELIAAHERGVTVRVIIDATSARNRYSKHGLLREAGIPVKVEDWNGKMHMKAAALDGHTLIVGSMNWTVSGAAYNDENTLILRAPDLAAEFEVVFDDLWDSIPQR